LNITQYTALIASVLSLLIVAYTTNKLFSNIGLNILLSVNILGVIIGCLLVMKQMSFHSEYVDKICSLFNKNDCNNVLESKASKLWETFGWSEIGLGYFAANILIVLFLPKLVSYLAVINLLTLPYAFWSVWYQKYKAKQWCPLCLATQVVLCAIFSINLIFGGLKIIDFNIVNLIVTGSIYLIFILIINLLVPNLNKEKQNENINYEINSIKANENVFSTLLKQQPYFDAAKENSELIFGNKNATLQISILTNPYCNPCAFMHKRVEKFLKDTNNNVSIQYILSSFREEYDNINRYFIAVYRERGEKEALKIYENWFEKGKLLEEKFFDALHLNINTEEVETEFKKHKLWREKTQINATPTVLVNGCQLPENYQIEDLQWFVNCEID
jgi:protein-disulfide isomerase